MSSSTISSRASLSRICTSRGSQGHRGKSDPAHAGHGAQGTPVRVDRGTEPVAGALGRALGGPAHPRTQEASGAGDVHRGEAAFAAVAGGKLPLLRQETRTVDDAGAVQVSGSYYSALPAPLYSEVTVRVYEREIESSVQTGRSCVDTTKAAARAPSSSPTRTASSTPRARRRA